ncbi:MAG: hypothetical protein HZB35_02910, partial [Nitrospirae bacterium]|nr:hypothetical protein [Nitrospirota bacterium]
MTGMDPRRGTLRRGWWQGMGGLLILLVMGCAGAKPILAPNQHFKSVGAEAAETDVVECRKLA